MYGLKMNSDLGGESLPMISSLSKALAKKYHTKQEGGPGSGRHRGARIYKQGDSYRAITPSGHNIGPYKYEDKLKKHLDDYGHDFKLEKPGYDSDAPLKKEAISATSHPAQLRAQKKESFREYSTRKFKHVKESTDGASKGAHVFEVALIEEGLGNFKDRFFYTKEALKNAASIGLFEGIQCFADHPTSVEEQLKPERSTKDILGYYENVHYSENEDGQGSLIAHLCVGNSPSYDWALWLLTNSLEYSKKFKEKDLVGLSINASGSSESVPLEEFLKSDLPESILSKLNEASTQGVTEINVVRELTDAQSVDFVTKAGAGGKIMKMLEQEKIMKKKTKESKQHEDHQEDGMQMSASDAQGSADGATPDHADAEQDKALFAKMIKQYLGKDQADEDEMKMAKHAFECHREAGMEHSEAYEAAGKHLKMAMEIGKKMSQATEGKHEGEATESEADESESQEAEAEAEEAQTPPPSPKSQGKKESMTVIKLAGEIAKMRESLKQYEMRDYLEHKMKTCGKDNRVTKKFREALETLGGGKSKEQIDQTWKVFIKAFEAGSEEVGEQDSALFMEKNSYRQSNEKSGTDFSDCLSVD